MFPFIRSQMQDSITAQMPEEADNHNGYSVLFVSIQTALLFNYTTIYIYIFYVKESICTIFERYSANNKQLYIFKVWGL